MIVHFAKSKISCKGWKITKVPKTFYRFRPIWFNTIYRICNSINLTSCLIPLNLSSTFTLTLYSFSPYYGITRSNVPKYVIFSYFSKIIFTTNNKKKNMFSKHHSSECKLLAKVYVVTFLFYYFFFWSGSDDGMPYKKKFWTLCIWYGDKHLCTKNK